MKQKPLQLFNERVSRGDKSHGISEEKIENNHQNKKPCKLQGHTIFFMPQFRHSRRNILSLMELLNLAVLQLSQRPLLMSGYSRML